MLVPHLPFPFIQNVKRRLSPLKIHMGTFILFSVITMDNLFRYIFEQNVPSFPFHAVTRFGLILLPFFAQLAALGYVQTGVVYRVLALNAPTRPLDQKTYRVNVDEGTLIKTIEGSHLEGYSKIDDKLYEFKWRGAKFAVLALSGNQKSTVVSTVPYQMTVDSLVPTIETSEARNSLINDLEKRLEPFTKGKRRIEFTQITGPFDDSVSARALQFALKRTRSKLTILNEMWADVPSFHRIVIVLSILALAVMSGLYLMRIVTDVNTIVSTVVFVVIVVLLDLGIPLRDELLRRKKV